jgi:tetratricopeptide (TPR) repeat protein
MKTSVLTLLACGTLVVAGTGISQFSDAFEGPSRLTGHDAHETHAAVSLLGQFRTSFSSWLWLRTDLYLHNGTEMRPLSEGEAARGHAGVGGEYDGSDSLHDDSKIVQVVPLAKNDFRGLLGDVERSVKTFREMRGHSHNDPKIALPLFRLMTLADPGFVPGWVTGANVLARERSPEALQKAFRMLQEGLDANPDSVSIRTELARYWIRRTGELTRAIGGLEEAAKLSEQNFQRLDEDERDSSLNGFRWLALAYRDAGRFDDSGAAAERGLRLFRDDLVLMRLARPAPAVLSNEDYERWNSEHSGSPSTLKI